MGLSVLASQTSESGERKDIPAVEDPALAQARMAVRARDFKKAVSIWRASARRGSARAQYRLGVAYRSGRGVEKDPAKAAFWFTKASKSGDQDAQFALGKLYLGGLGIERNQPRAMELLGLAARRGHQEAKRTLERIGKSRSIAYATANGRVAANQNDPRATLNQAIRMGDLGSAQEALARGAPIDGAPNDESHWRPLILAVDHDRSDAVAMLLKHQANPNQTSRLGEPILILAIRKGNAVIVRQLLSAGSDPESRSMSGYTALMEAARHGRSRIIEDLLSVGANPKVTLDDHSSAADIARRFRFTKVASRLRRAGASTLLARANEDRFASNGSSRGQKKTQSQQAGTKQTASLPPLIEAARRGHADLVREILTSGVSLNTIGPEGDSALHRAADGGHAEVTEILLDAGIDPNLRGRDRSTALMRAMASAATEADVVVEKLIAASADPNLRDKAAAGLIDYAATGASARKLSLVSSAGGVWSPADVGSALERAALAGQVDAVRALIAVATRPTDHAKALCGAIGADQIEVLDLLVKMTAAFDTDCGDDRRPLLMAAHAGRREAIKKLLIAGANPNGEPDGRDTALIAAASRGHREIMHDLLEGGASIDHRGARRMTALMGAAANGHIQVVEDLLNARADRRMRNDSSRTAFDLAEAAGHKSIADAIDSFRPGWGGAWFGADAKAD